MMLMPMVMESLRDSLGECSRVACRPPSSRRAGDGFSAKGCKASDAPFKRNVLQREMRRMKRRGWWGEREEEQVALAHGVPLAQAPRDCEPR